MSQVYKEKIMRDINDIPVDMLPGFYKIVHLLKQELVGNKNKPGTRSSLKGIWKGVEIEEALFDEAKKSLFKYE
jgi:hypothetical protein